MTALRSGEQRPATALTVIVPVFNGAATIGQCLASVFASTLQNFEVIVVDDSSTDRSSEIARTFPCKVVTRPSNGGPAAARNHGARLAQAEILYFLDADILIQPETLSQALQALRDRPEVCAVFGSFGKHTVPDDFVSVYKNLLHHYTHQNSNPDATAFCGGFSAIHKGVFLDLGGFNPQQRYLEDVEL
jgi:glycosyltransferase involved in cell wall biosynthesis